MPTPFINPPVIAHRGASAYAPENTLSALLHAKNLGAKWVEFDVMLSGCHETVVFHDERLERTTNGSGLISEYPYRDLLTLDAGSWFSGDFAGERIPTLREVIAFLNANHLSANIELKPCLGTEELLAQKVLTLLSEHWNPKLPPPLLSSFSLTTLKYLRKYSVNCLLGFLMDDWLVDWEKSCDELNCTTVNVNYHSLDTAKIKEIKSTRRWLLAYTVNHPTLARELFSQGVDAVFTDYPDKMLAIFRSDSNE